MPDPIRLSKHLMTLLNCSRREADLYIEGGWVAVDGEVIEAPQFKLTTQHVELLPGAKAEPLPPATLLLHAVPGDVIDTTHGPLDAARQWQGDASGMRVLRRHLQHHGLCLPLPPGASGLQVLTQDTRLQRTLADDANRFEQEFVVDVNAEPASEVLTRFNAPFLLRGQTHSGHKVSRQSERRLRFALKNPPPGLIEFMCGHVGLDVVSMRRLRIGAVPLAKLPAGQWRYLGPRERF